MIGDCHDVVTKVVTSRITMYGSAVLVILAAAAKIARIGGW